MKLLLKVYLNILLPFLSLALNTPNPESVSLASAAQDTCVSWQEDFNGGFGSFVPEGQASIINGNLRMKISLGNTPNPQTKVIMGYGTSVHSTKKILYGTLTARIKTARMGGVVTAFILMSDQKDEIDWEWVGKNEYESQTNYYYKGILDYTKGKYIKNAFNTHAAYHDYTIRWTPNDITWLIDNIPVRTVTKAEALGNLPNTPSAIYFSLWDGGAGLPGTSDWAGGRINWNDPEYKSKGYMEADIDYIRYSCL